MKTLYTKSNALWSCCLVAMAILCAFPAMAQTTFPFSASPALAIPDDSYNGTLASMASSSVAVTGVTGASVINIEVDLSINHTYVGDLVIKLRAPNGDLLTLVSRPGAAETADDGNAGPFGSQANMNGSTLTFSDLGITDAEAMATGLTNAQFVCTTNGLCSFFPNPGITTSPTQTFASLFGGTMNGNWTLYIGDKELDDIGTLNSWAIRITTVNPLITVYKTVAVEGGNGDCADDAEPLLTANTLNVASGTDVCYFYTAFNDGDVALGLHDVSDDVFGPLQTALAFDLQPTQGAVFSYGPVTINGTVTNVATWTAYNAGPLDVATNTASATVTVTGPSNIICQDAVAVSCGSVTAGTTIGSTEDVLALPTYNGGSKGAGVWYTFTGDGQDVTFSTCTNTDFDSEINVYSGVCLNLVLVNGNDDACGAGSSVTVPTVNGTSYFIYVSDYITGGIGGNFELTVACAPPVVGCNNATADGQYPFSSVTPDAGGAVTTIITDQYAGSEYSVITGIQSGSDYEFTHANGAYITVRQGTVTGSIVGSGYSPLTITAGSAADLYVHWTLDDLCTVDGTGSFETTVQLIIVPPCDATAGTLTADASPVSLVGSSATISATEGTAPFVPSGYSVLYVLTEGAGLVIIDAAATPSFTVSAAGDYTIHTLVYDPTTLDVSTVVFGTTTGFDVNGLLIQGGGSICGALDAAGAPITVEDEVTCDATAGTLTADASPVTLVGGSATISATEGTAPFVPSGYSVLYVLTEGAGLVIIDAAATPSFTVSAAGDYTIHTLVYDPTTLDVSTVVFGTTTGFDVNGLLIQGGGSICGALDVAGAPITVEDEVTCDATAGTLTADASPVSLVGGSATISATQGTAPFVPAGYSVLYVLTEGAGLVIIDAAATPSFTVTAAGDYTIHTLVYDPTTLDVSTVVFGTTTGFDVNGLLIQGGGTICGALDVAGAPIVVEDITVGISSALNRSLSIYPNPSNGQFIVELNGVDGKATMNILDMMGRRVYTQAMTLNGTFRQSISLDVAKGTYVLQVVTSNGIATRKVELN